MQGGAVHPAIGQAVAPGHQLAGFGLDGLVQMLEAGGAASLGLVQIHHHRPGALAAISGVRIIIQARRLEIIGVHLELLAHGITLALQGFGMGDVEPGIIGQLAIDPAHQRIIGRQISGFTGAEITARAIGIGDSRRPAMHIDQADQPGAIRRRQKALADHHLHSLVGHFLGAGKPRHRTISSQSGPSHSRISATPASSAPNGSRVAAFTGRPRK